MRCCLLTVVLIATALSYGYAVSVQANARASAGAQSNALGAKNKCLKVRSSTIMFGGSIGQSTVKTLEECKGKLATCLSDPESNCMSASYLTKSKSCLLHDKTPEAAPGLVLKSDHGLLISPSSNCTSAEGTA